MEYSPLTDEGAKVDFVDAVSAWQDEGVAWMSIFPLRFAPRVFDCGIRQILDIPHDFREFGWRKETA